MSTPTKTLAEELQAGLAGFYGTEHYYGHWTSRLIWTDGVQYLAEKAGAYWLIDAIASWQIKPKVRREPFQVWTLKVNREAKADPNADKPPVMAVLTGKDDEPGRVLARQEIEFTDFPLDSIKLYVEGGVLLLPSEH